MTYNHSKDLHLFKDIIRNIKEEPIKQRAVASDYDLLLTFKEGKETEQTIHLYLGEYGERSAFMHFGKDDIAYFTSIESTEILRQLLEPGE